MSRTHLVSAAAVAAVLTWTAPSLAQTVEPNVVASTGASQDQQPATAATGEPRPAPAAPTEQPQAPSAEAAPQAAKPAADIALPAPALALPKDAPAIELPAPPVFALAAEIAERLKRERVSGSEREDRDAATKVYERRNGEPIWVGEKGLSARALALINEIRSADGYGLTAASFRLPEARTLGGGEPTRAALADAEVTLSLAALKYARHARGGRIDPAVLSKSIDRKPVVYAPDSVLSELSGAARPDTYLRSFHPQHPQFERLRLKYIAVRSGQGVPEQAPQAVDAKGRRTGPVPLSSAALEKKLLANLEMWRWMPIDMGDYHIQNNIPEFTTRIVRSGKLVHMERIVTGKPDTQTPIFSDHMQLVVFKPFWNVPESIKWKELQPQLTSNPNALAKAGLRAAYNGREVDPATVDWSSADMRAFHVFQPPGTGNALGQVKFLFPNKHDVYMHDTPHKSLFNQSVRAYSHGCMRVRDPLKLAEVLLAQDKGWDMGRIVQLANAGPENNEIRLSKKVPIHVTYFTAVVGDDGRLQTFNDLYDHEARVHMGLQGKAHLIVQPKEERYVPPARGGVRFVEKQQKGSPIESWLKNVFSF